MNFEFDKEMDFLLREHLKTERAAGNSLAEPHADAAHLDADDLAAFAENSLPQIARQQFAAHLADCDDCRKTLSSLILINETEIEAASATAETVQVVKPARASWLESLQKLFEFPALGYATAGLAILLIGTIAFVALRSPNQNQDAAIARVEPTELAPAQSETIAPPTAAAPPTELKAEQSSNTAAEPSPNVETANNAQPAGSTLTQSNSATSAEQPLSRTTREASGNNNRSDLVAANTAAVAPSKQSADAPTSANTNAAASTAAPRPRTNSQPAAVAESRASARSAPPASRDAEVQRKSERDDGLSDDASDIFGTRARAATTTSTPESRTVLGKVFQKKYNVWQDSSYKQQPRQLVLRSSKDYKKLSAGLRAVAEKLGGDVIVVWQNKAYQIR